MIFASGRPILLLPEAWPAERLPRHLVIGWNGSAEATRGVANAMPLLIDAEVVEIVVVPSAGIHTRAGFDPGAALVAHLGHLGGKARHLIPEGRSAGQNGLDY